MEGVAKIGLDLAKNVFQVHGIDVQGKILVRRQLRRAELLEFFAKVGRCLVGMEGVRSGTITGHARSRCSVTRSG